MFMVYAKSQIQSAWQVGRLSAWLNRKLSVADAKLSSALGADSPAYVGPAIVTAVSP